MNTPRSDAEVIEEFEKQFTAYQTTSSKPYPLLVDWLKTLLAERPLTPQATDKGWRQVKVTLKGYSSDEVSTASPIEVEGWERDFTATFGDCSGYKPEHYLFWIERHTSQALKSERERMVAIGEELKRLNPSCACDGDCKRCDHSHNLAISEYQQKIKSLE